MLAFVGWLILLALSWLLALVALVLFRVVWLLSIPFRLVGISVPGMLGAIEAVVRLPGRLLKGRP